MWTDSARAKICPSGQALRKRPDRRRVRADRAARCHRRHRLGRPRTTDLRAVLDAIFYLLRTGCQWSHAAQAVSTEEHGVRLFPPLVAGRHAARALLRPAGLGPTGSRPGSPAERGHRRQPVGQDQRKAAARAATTPARRSTAASATSWSTRWACCCAASSMPPASRTATGWHRCCARIRRRFPWLGLLFADGGYQGEVAAAAGPRRAARSGDRQALRQRPRLRRPAQALDRRAHLRLVRPQPAAGQGRRDPDRQQHRHALPRRYPPAHPPTRKPLSIPEDFSDGLIGCRSNERESKSSDGRQYIDRWTTHGILPHVGPDSQRSHRCQLSLRSTSWPACSVDTRLDGHQSQDRTLTEKQGPLGRTRSVKEIRIS